MTTDRFQSMGCEVIVGGATPTELSGVKGLFAEREQVFSRFLADSELNRVNACAGRPVLVSALFAQVTALALQVAEETEGLVDPTVGRALEAAGYVCDFAELESDPAPAGPPSPGAWSSLRVRGRCVWAPPGVHLDLNGVVKALAVEDALDLLAGDGFVSAGGDLAARGEITVSLPGSHAVLLKSGALATSGSVKRHWLRGGELQHHLIDPRTGRPSRSPWGQVTVCGATCLAADTAAKAAYLVGAEGPAWLDSRGLPGRFVDGDGRVTVNQCWQHSMDGAPSCI
jgi:thiamine biosynthesis lipoprotein